MISSLDILFKRRISVHIKKQIYSITLCEDKEIKSKVLDLQQRQTGLIVVCLPQHILVIYNRKKYTHPVSNLINRKMRHHLVRSLCTIGLKLLSM